MKTDTKNFIRLVRDEADTLRQSPFCLEELSVNDLELDNNQNSHRWMTRLHYPISKLGVRLDDSERHTLFGVIFGRKIKSTKELTGIEITALNTIVELDTNKYREVIEDILND